MRIITIADRPKFKIKRVKDGYALFALLENGMELVPLTNPADRDVLGYCQAVKKTFERDFKRHGEISF